MTPYIERSGLLPGGVLPLRAERTIREPYVELGWPGLDPKRPCLDILIFDDSGSIMAPHGADPVGNRFEEARRAIKLVSSWATSDRSKIAILHFDHPHGSSGVVALNDRQLGKKLGPCLESPGTLGISDLNPSLTEAERLAEAYPDHDVRMTHFTDYELTDHEPAAMLSRVASFPGHVHAVVLGGVTPPGLEAADNVTVTPLSPGDPPGAFAAAIHRSLTATRRASRYSVLHTPRGREVLS